MQAVWLGHSKSDRQPISTAREMHPRYTNPLSFNDDPDPEPGSLLIADPDLLFR
jgi:hypothetical protein